MLTYKKAGVDIHEGDRFVDLITPMVRRTFRPEVMADIGSFGGLFKLDWKKYKEPVLCSGTDGVGTKLKIAFLADKHDTVGIDLVAMCVNDILTCGAEPLFFLDYFATGKLKPEKAAEVVKGIVEGCRQSGCALIGGETAEMPGFYEEGEYDLAGFSVGIVEKDEIVQPGLVEAGDIVVGIASSGIHSNGYSLVRKVFFDLKGMSFDEHLPELGTSIGEKLLKPTRIYVDAVNALRGKVKIHGMAHITGGGIPGNLPRALPDGLMAKIKKDSWPEQNIFGLIRKLGEVPEDDMRDTFNLGLGYVLIVPAGSENDVVGHLGQAGYDSFVVGEIVKGEEGVKYV